jgi:putative NIF3 family GTP cyclohydrolase 1 type 2
VGIISGGAQKELHQAIDAGLDVFITGEASEWVMNLSLESGTRFVSAGHYATERFGVQVLGEYIERRYGIEVEFIDVPNPV